MSFLISSAMTKMTLISRFVYVPLLLSIYCKLSPHSCCQNLQEMQKSYILYTCDSKLLHCRLSDWCNRSLSIERRIDVGLSKISWMIFNTADTAIDYYLIGYLCRRGDVNIVAVCFVKQDVMHIYTTIKTVWIFQKMHVGSLRFILMLHKNH